MNYVEKVFDGFHYYFFDLNAATLSGAIDVVAIPQEGGELRCTPFHVRFGKLQLLRSTEKVVTVYVNDVESPVVMKLGRAGEAYFVEEVEGPPSAGEYLASPITSPPSSPRGSRRGGDDLVSSVGAHVTPAAAAGTQTGLAVNVEEKGKLASGGSGKNEKAALASSSPASVAPTAAAPKQGSRWRSLFSWRSKPPPPANGTLTLSQSTPVLPDPNDLAPRMPRVPSAKSLRKVSVTGEDDEDDEEEEGEFFDASDDQDSVPNAANPVIKAALSLEDGDENFLYSSSDGAAPAEAPAEETALFALDLEGAPLSHRTPRRARSTSALVRPSGSGQFRASTSSLPTPSATSGPPASSAGSSSSSSLVANNGNASMAPTPTSAPLSPAVSALIAPVVVQASSTLPPPGIISVVTVAAPASSSSPATSILPSAAPSSAPSSPQVTRSPRPTPAVSFADQPSANANPSNPSNPSAPSSSSSSEIPAVTSGIPISSSVPTLPVISQSPPVINTSLASGVMPADDDLELNEDPSLFELSLCGRLIEGLDARSTARVFRTHRISHAEFCANPGLLYDDRLVCRLQERYYPWSIAGPIIISILAFGRPLDDEAVRELEAREAAKYKEMPKEQSSGWRWWWRRGSSKQTAKPAASTTVASASPSVTVAASSSSTSSLSSAALAATPVSPQVPMATLPEASSVPPSSGGQPALVPASASARALAAGEGARDVEQLLLAGQTSAAPAESEMKRADGKTTHLRKSVRPSAKMLAMMNLKPGANPELRGKQEVRATIFYWEADTRLVVSDIDGTITKSDVMGQLMPMLGRDWTHLGVNQLYCNIAKNGYKFVYLTSRAIGQAGQTKAYLKGEVIQRRPEEFKIAALKDVKLLFPEKGKTFYAGFGNRQTDVISYRAVGVPQGRIFTINPAGEITVVNSSLRKSYVKLNDMVQEMFPPLHAQRTNDDEEFNDFNYWKVPLPAIEALPKK